MPRPLEGLHVVEVAIGIQGPAVGLHFANMGADVIKVEPPTGDPWRCQNPIAENESRVFLPLNRGVRSICLDLKSDGSRNALKKIIIVLNSREPSERHSVIFYDLILICDLIGHHEMHSDFNSTSVPKDQYHNICDLKCCALSPSLSFGHSILLLQPCDGIHHSCCDLVKLLLRCRRPTGDEEC